MTSQIYIAGGQVKLVDKIKQSSYLCVILPVKYKKISIVKKTKGFQLKVKSFRNTAT